MNTIVLPPWFTAHGSVKFLPPSRPYWTHDLQPPACGLLCCVARPPLFELCVPLLVARPVAAAPVSLWAALRFLDLSFLRCLAPWPCPSLCSPVLAWPVFVPFLVSRVGPCSLAHVLVFVLYALTLAPCLALFPAAVLFLFATFVDFAALRARRARTCIG